jgi:hypothetical protein
VEIGAKMMQLREKIIKPSEVVAKFHQVSIDGMKYHFAVRNCQDWVKQFLTSVDEDLLQHLPKTLRRTVLVSLNVTLF